MVHGRWTRFWLLALTTFFTLPFLGKRIPFEAPLAQRDDDYYGSEVVQRLDYWGSTGRNHSAGNVVQVVSHRELLLGCNSFQEYLSPNFHTVLVFPTFVAKELRLYDLVKNASLSRHTAVSAGIHLFLTEDWAGSHLARKIGYSFAKKELGDSVRYMSAINCDVHPLPSNHARYTSLESIVLQMIKDMESEQEYRSRGQSLVTNYDERGCAIHDDDNSEFCNGVPHSKRPILAMNTILFEDIPNATSLLNFHGRDTLKWYKNGGWSQRPESLGSNPWLQDSSAFFEDHMILFDLRYLDLFADQYFEVSPKSFPDENNFLGPAASLFDLTLVRNNDLVLRIQFGHEEITYEPSVNPDTIRIWNWQLLGQYRKPQFLAENWNRAKDVMGVTTTHRPFVPFVYKHCRKDVWFPRGWNNQSMVDDPFVLPVLDSYLSYSGYDRISSPHTPQLLYTYSKIYPATRLVHTAKSGSQFFKIIDAQGGSIKFYHALRDEERQKQSEDSSSLEMPSNGILKRESFYACKW